MEDPMFGKSVVICSLLNLLLFSAVSAEKFTTENFSFQPQNIENLEIKIELGAGKFDLQVEDITEVAIAKVVYNDRKVEILADYRERGKTGIVEFESETRKKFNIDSNDNLWDITLSEKYPVELDISIGACESNFDLGGLPMEYLNFEVGAAEAVLRVSRPNPRQADEISIDAGAASFKIEELGNANFKRLSFDGGMGDFDIDFSGKYTGKSKAKISLGVGSATVRIPADLPVRIETDKSFLSSVDFSNADSHFLEGDDFYETDDFRTSDYSLDLEISVGLGSVEIIFTD
jgi:hypothetical protein